MSSFDPVPENIDLSPRRVTGWSHGVKKVYENVIPTPFSQDRAKEIQEKTKHFLQGPTLQQVMTNEEIAYVFAVWDSIPDRRSSFMTAFNAIKEGKT